VGCLDNFRESLLAEHTRHVDILAPGAADYHPRNQPRPLSPSANHTRSFTQASRPPDANDLAALAQGRAVIPEAAAAGLVAVRGLARRLAGLSPCSDHQSLEATSETSPGTYDPNPRSLTSISQPLHSGGGHADGMTTLWNLGTFADVGN
jgi:hypothetical protein